MQCLNESITCVVLELDNNHLLLIEHNQNYTSFVVSALPGVGEGHLFKGTHLFKVGAYLRGGANLRIYGIYFFYVSEIGSPFERGLSGGTLISLNNNLFLYLHCKLFSIIAHTVVDEGKKFFSFMEGYTMYMYIYSCITNLLLCFNLFPLRREETCKHWL